MTSDKIYFYGISDPEKFPGGCINFKTPEDAQKAMEFLAELQIKDEEKQKALEEAREIFESGEDKKFDKYVRYAPDSPLAKARAWLTRYEHLFKEKE